jgi:hypothetical protein
MAERSVCFCFMGDDRLFAKLSYLGSVTNGIQHAGILLTIISPLSRAEQLRDIQATATTETIPRAL